MDMMAIRRRILLGGKKSRLPSAYQEVEYIEGTGEQYLRTNYIPQRYDEVDCVFSISSIINITRKFKALFSAGAGTYRFIVILSVNADVDGAYYKYFASGDAVRFNFYPKTGVKYTISIKNDGEIYCNGYSNVSHYEEDIDGQIGQKSLRVFARPGSGWSSSIFAGKIYSFKITNAITRLNLVPCYRKSDGEIGMYDTVSKTFYTNAGKGTFLKGADVWETSIS